MPHRVALLGLLLLVGCGRSFEALTDDEAPRLLGISPAQGFGYDIVRLSGRNLDPDPAANIVRFPWTTTPGDHFDEQGRLVVYVPPTDSDVGSFTGPLSVTTRVGTTNPSPENFLYLGSGHPAQGTPVDALPLLHRPRRLVSTAAGVLFASETFQALVGPTGVVAAPGVAITDLAVAPDGSLFAVGTGGLLLQLDPETGETLAETSLTEGEPSAVLPLPDPEAELRVEVVVRRPRGGWALAQLDGEELTPAPLLELPLDSLLGSAIAADGTVALAGRRLGSAGIEAGLLLIDPASRSPRWLPTDLSSPSGPLAFDGDGTLFAPLDDGSLARLPAGATTWEEPLPAEANSPAGGIALLPADPLLDGAVPLLLLSRPALHQVEARSALDGSLAWVAPLRGNPTALAIDEEGRLHVADSSANVLDLLDASTGRPLGRRSTSARLGPAAGCRGSIAFDYGADRYVAAYRLGITSPVRAFIPAPGMSALAVVDASVLKPLAPIPVAPELLGVVSGPPEPSGDPGEETLPRPGIWTLHRTAVAHLLNEEGAISEEAPLVTGLRAPPTHLLFPPDGTLLVVSARAVERFRGSVRIGSVERDIPLAQAALDSAGRLLLLWRAADGSIEAQRWPIDAIGAAGPDQSLRSGPSEQTLLDAPTLLDGPLLLFAHCFDPEGTEAPCARPLLSGATLTLGERYPSVVTTPGRSLISPDRRYFTWRADVGSTGLLDLNYWDDIEAGSTTDYGQMSPFLTWRLADDALPLGMEPSGSWLLTAQPTTDRLLVVH